MTKLLAALSILVSLAACGGSAKTTAVPEAAPKCDFGETIRKAQGGGGKPRTITPDEIDKAVAQAPAELRTATRTVLDVSRQVALKSEQADKNPEAMGEVLELMADPKFDAAMTQLTDYFKTECPELAKTLPSFAPPK
jgi:hypothetical protein